MSARHRDRNNAGVSAIVSFGNHVGGVLMWWPKDSCNMPTRLLENKDATKVDPFQTPCFFDGTKAHEACSFVGDRITLIFYEVKWKKGALTSVMKGL